MTCTTCMTLHISLKILSLASIETFSYMAWYKFVAKLSHLSFSYLERINNFNQRIINFFHAVQTGFWLGVMGEKSLDYSDELIYNSTKKYREDNYNLSGLFDWEKPMIQKHFLNAKNILVIAAGGGREVVALSRMGFEVDAYECNTTLVDYATSLLQGNGIKSTIKYLPRNTVPDEIKKYDGIIIGWGAYSFITSSKKRLSFLSDLYPFLHKESSLIISFLYSKRRNKSDKVIKNVSNFFRFFSGSDTTEAGDRLVPDYMHYFTEEEIKDELTRCNYKVKDFQIMGDGCVIAGILIPETAHGSEETV